MSPERQYAVSIEPLLAQAAGYAHSILRNRQDAQDAVQQAALRGLERIRTFDANRSFKGWWFAIVRNCCIDMLRQSRAARASRLEHHDIPGPAVPDTPTDTTDWERLSTAMNLLSESHREILHLRYFADLSYGELAESLDIPPGTVMSRLHLARKALQKQMSEEDQ